MLDIKALINNNLLTQTTLKSKRMEYSEQIFKFIAKIIEDLRNNTMKKGASF